ncbi:hypothetical protein P1X14_06005 [Sphingomonas sp. AOB5]|uniref:hypothetical protein n=1 Tax=Sphingomonas sp. AOB5 TaxID=3034017 RepID=UPI0023F67700|nr:hypothetical protein [Sphingomonas sp. AOB5]MDF7774789.1 hypothetical protein [Sphingomonas sp. AOB5]
MPEAPREPRQSIIQKYGYTWKAYFIALVLLPPAAILIPLKIPHVAMPWRAGAALMVILIHGAILAGGLTLLAELFGGED